MSVLSVRNVLPVVTAVVSTLFLATAVPHELVLESPPPLSLLRAQVQGCVMDGRDAQACLDEADGKALLEHADWLARNDAAARRASQ